MNSITVSKLVRYLKNKLETDQNLSGITVSGEISNFHRHSSGHLYFTLKDTNSAISCVMFSSRANLLKFEPKNGDKVEVSCSVSIFEVTGQLQIYINSMKKAGLGDLFQQYEELKEKLGKEGYFDEDHKINLPTDYPENVAVLVGDKSAAMSDIKTCFKRRWPLANITYYPVLVQGFDAPKDIIKNLMIADELDYDYIILARGGGSFEDLFCFNDEELVKTIYNLKTFIITGIGHEQDFTLADFVADLRAPTPTATVELTMPDIKDVLSEISEGEIILRETMDKRIKNQKELLEGYINNRYFMNPNLLLNNTLIKLDYYTTKLQSFSQKLNSIYEKINVIQERIESNLKQNLLFKKEKLVSDINLLKMYSIDDTLKRGYSLVYKNEKLINNKNLLCKDDNIEIRLYGGKLNATIKGE